MNSSHLGSSDLTAESHAEAAHTPGPWHWTCDGDNQPGRVGVTLQCEPVEHCGYDSHCIALTQPGKFDQRANARLIAAAPELLEALREFTEATNALHVAQHDGVNVHGAVSAFVGAREMALAAIAKATA